MYTPTVKHGLELTFSPIQAVYTAQCSLGYTLGIAAHGLANNGLSDEQRSALFPRRPGVHMEVRLRYAITFTK
jgi:hypothetical protein